MKLQKRYDQFKQKLDEAVIPSETPFNRPRNPRAASLAMGEELESVRGELERANTELDQVRGGQLLQRIDASHVRPSQFKNRDDRSFESADFRELVDSIRVAGGNSVPANVRRIAGDGEPQFELIYGHRRHRACLELGLPLLAIVDGDVDDRALYEAMTRENSQRGDLTPWEWGKHYARGMSLGYETQKDLARETGRSEAHVSLALDLVSLPEGLVSAFASPLDLQLKWGRELKNALTGSRDKVLAKARELANREAKPSPVEVFGELREAGRGPVKREARPDNVQIKGKTVSARLITEGKRTSVQIPKRLSDAQQATLAALIAGFLDAEFTR